MLNQLAKAHAARVGADRNSELSREEEDRDVLIHTGHPTRVHLADADRAVGAELLVHDAVGHVLAGRHADGCHGVAIR